MINSEYIGMRFRLLTYHICSLLVLMTIASCTPTIPDNAVPNGEDVDIYPDYTDVYVPYNIAPLNFHINREGKADFVSVVEDAEGQKLVAGGVNAQFDEDDWHAMLERNKGKDLMVTVYVKAAEKWERYNAFTIHVAEEPIDEYISYRLIEPSYVSYRSMQLCQRNLTNFDESVIYANTEMSRRDEGEEYQCVNCHSYQNYHTDNFQFHARQYKGGTIVVHDGKITKLNLKTDSTIAAGVYPSWHPTAPIIAYSVNHTVQAFLIDDPDHKIEVLDTLSDMILYYVDTNEVQIVQKTKDSMETTPGWSPKGDALYYCSAYHPVEGPNIHFELSNHYDSIRYDIIRQSYDVATRTLGEPDTVFKASEINKSASFPRVSPDGRYLLFGLADYGYFHIWHKSSDLFVIDLNDMSRRRLGKMNSNDVEGYHAWSSNGRWIVFSTRREDGNYSRAYIGYFDKNGKDYKAFAVPQRDPLYNKRLMKSFNVPEFMVQKVQVSPQELADVIRQDPIPAKLFK